MAESCRITPQVKNSRGEEVESKLYMDLKNLLSQVGKGGRKDVLPLYQRTLNKQFTSDMKSKGATFDENGEVTLYDLINLTELGSQFTENDILNYLNKEFKDKTYSKDNAFEEANKINTSIWNRAYVATLNKVGKDKFQINVHSQKSNIPNEYKRVIFAGRLSKRLKKLLSNWGIAVDVYDELENKVTNGYIDFENIAMLPDGLIHLIKIAKGSVGRKALPEEFAHFVVRSMSNSPLITRALNQLRQNNLYIEVLGEEYEQYKQEYNQQARERGMSIEDVLIEEALGKILAQKIENRWVDINLINRVWNLFKNIFNKYDENQIKQVTLECDEDLNSLTDDLLNGKYKHLQTTNLGKGRLYQQASSQIKQTRNIWDKFYETMLRTNIIYNKRRKELGLTSEEDEENLLESQHEVIEKLDIAAHNDWSVPLIQYKNGRPEYRTKEEYTIDAAISLIELAVKNTKKILTTVGQLKEQIDNNTYKGSLNVACAKVRAIMDYIEAYSEIYDDFDRLLDTTFADPVLDSFPQIQDIKAQLIASKNTLRDQLEEIRNEVLGQKSQRSKINTNVKDRLDTYKRPLAIEVFLQGFKQFFPEDVVLAFGHSLNGEILTLEEMLTYADYDITFISAWANSMANTSDPIARMYDAIVKKQKEEARQECLNIQRIIQDAGQKLEKFGFGARDHSWMYERYTKDIYKINSDGNEVLIHRKGDLVLDSTGMPMYIKAYDEEAARIDRENFLKQLKKDNTLTDEQKKQKYSDFIDERYDQRRGQLYPKKEFYPSKNYSALTDAQKEFYNTFMDCKIKLDKYLPIFTEDSHKAIVVRKDAVQRVLSLFKRNKSEMDIHANEFFKSFADWFSELFTRKETDEDFGDTTNVLTNFSGKEVKKIPIYNTYKAKDTPLFNYSTNLVANMCIYAQTATNYKAMAKVIETLELGHDIMNYRYTAKRFADRKLIAQIKDGTRVFQEQLFLDGTETNFSKRISNYLDMQVYGRKREKRSKTAEVFARLVGGFTTAASALVGITNILQGLGQINIEMIAGEYFTMGDLLKAKKFYWQHILPVLLDSTKTIKDSKLSLLSQDFNMMQEWDTKIRELRQYEKNPLARFDINSALYILNHIGEHYMQHITFLAMLNHEKIVDSNGKYVSVLDAYERVPLSKDSSSMKLALKRYQTTTGTSQTYKTEDGRTIVTMEQLKARQASRKDRYGKDVDLYSKSLLKDGEIAEYEWKGQLTRKGAKINQDMHGIYNQDDKNMLQQKAWGNLLIMYRKHIAPNTMKRWKSEWYDADLGTVTVGYQRQLPKLFLDYFRIALDPVTGEKKWARLTWSKRDKANAYRNYAQALNWLEINLLISILEAGLDDDDDDLWYKLLLISAYRAKTENSQFEPLAIFAKHNILEEWVRLIEQPVVGTNIIKNFVELFRLTDPEVWKKEMKSGPYKGKKEAEKILGNVIPIARQVRQHNDPDELLKFYRRDVGSAKLTDKFAEIWSED